MYFLQCGLKNFFDYRCNNKDSLESVIKDAVKAEEVDQRVHKGQGVYHRLTPQYIYCPVLSWFGEYLVKSFENLTSK